MRLVIISDTHGQHEQLGVLEGDVLIHCGDSCGGNGRDDGHVRRMDDWFARQRFDRIFCIGGNHDRAVQIRSQIGWPVFQHATYLEDSADTFGGLTFYGAPWTPELMGWPFYKTARELRRRWAAIPRGVDVLITHTPPRDILDRTSLGLRIGCPSLREAVQGLGARLHCFGHVHASAGQRDVGGTRFINASSVARGQRRLRPPVVLEL